MNNGTSRLGVGQRQPHDVVIADLHAERVLHVMAAPPRLPLLKRLHAGDEAVIELLVLIAVHRIVEIEREVVEEHQVVADAVGLNFAQRRALAVLPFGGDAVAIACARRRSDRWIRSGRSAPASIARCGDASRGVPLAVVAHHGQRQAVDVVAAAVAHDAIELSVLVGPIPGPVVRGCLECRQQVAVADARRRGEQRRARIRRCPPPGAGSVDRAASRS